MNNLLIQICTMMVMGSSQGATACNQSINQAYPLTGELYIAFNNEETLLKNESLELYKEIPYHDYIAGAGAIGYVLAKKAYSVNIVGPLWTSFDGSTYKCELKWNL